MFFSPLWVSFASFQRFLDSLKVSPMFSGFSLFCAVKLEEKRECENKIISQGEECKEFEKKTKILRAHLGDRKTWRE